jgi:transposase
MQKDTNAALAAGTQERVKNQKAIQAKRILIGVDVHLRSYFAARKVDNAAVGVVSRFKSQEELLLYVEKQKAYAQEVVVLYETGPLGYTLYRALKAAGVSCYVCAPDSSQQQSKRRKNDAIDARTLTGNLFNYLSGNPKALQLVRIPTEEQERVRLKSRQHDQLVKERKRLAAQGNSLLLAQGYGSWKNWWRPRAFSRLSQLIPEWIKQLLISWVDVLRSLDQTIAKSKVMLAQSYRGPRPKGAGAASLFQLGSEVLDWGLYTNRRQPGCLAGMVPSEWSSGGSQRQGPITKVGVPAIRRIITEMVWRIILFQPQYGPVQKWKPVLEGPNRALKKKAVVAIGRQLMVDLWQLHTGRASAQELNLIMMEG